MMRRWVLLHAAAMVFSWGCAEPSEEPKGTPEGIEKLAPAAPGAKLQRVEEDEGYEELDVFIDEAEPDEGPPPLRVQFTSEVEGDEEDGGPFYYRWDFGDGSTSSEANPVHTYTRIGEYEVTLVATDDKGNNGSDDITVYVEEEE